jgi:DNA-binding NarL/FixJ family response regulator
VLKGAEQDEIARRMSIAPKTVANHISAIFTKLPVTDRGEAIVLARDAGLGRNGQGAAEPG